MSVVFLNGQYLPLDQASVPVTDRGFLFGDGVFTTIRVENGQVIFLNQHLARLKSHCKELKISFPDIHFSHLEQLIAYNHAKTGVWRLKIMISGGSGSELFLENRAPGVVLMMMQSYVEKKGPIYLCLYPYSIISAFSKIKSLSYLQRLHVMQYAKEQGCDDAIVCSVDGAVCETAFSNIFWEHQGTLYTPSHQLPYLRGIALEEILKASKLRVVEGLFSLEEIPKEARIYLCNALSGKVPAIIYNTK